ncbi:MAG: hypothetical protein A2Z96_06205 [Spirochaetes bacterium GWB1_48_6]|nr:MAG: hypothetical protein A2Z96_06205 [Spirochaetes bacterium GWB1_48_6]
MEFIGWERGIIFLVQLGFGFIAAVAAVYLWSLTREGAWLLAVLATVLSYTDVLFQFLDALGIFPMSTYQWGGVSLIRVGFAAGVPLLYALAFLLAAFRQRKL